MFNILYDTIVNTVGVIVTVKWRRGSSVTIVPGSRAVKLKNQCSTPKKDPTSHKDKTHSSSYLTEYSHMFRTTMNHHQGNKPMQYRIKPN
jgi:hypothetical protein